MTNEIEQLTREQKVLIYTLGLCEELVAKGLLEGGRFHHRAMGTSLFQSLRESGFRPTDYELHCAMHALQTVELDK